MAKTNPQIPELAFQAAYLDTNYLRRLPPAPINRISGFEFELIKALRAIVSETMAFPPVRPSSSESYLPPELITQAQDALKLYGLDIERNPDMMASGASS